MTKTLAKLLKEKNLLAARLNEIKSRMNRENVVEGDNVSKYDVKKLYAELADVTEQLIRVKTAISQLNVQVVDKIYRMGELKSQIQFLKNLNVNEGTVTESGDRWSGGVAITKTYKPQFDRVFVDSEIEKLTEQINELQEQLDTYNYTAKVDM